MNQYRKKLTETERNKQIEIAALKELCGCAETVQTQKY